MIYRVVNLLHTYVALVLEWFFSIFVLCYLFVSEKVSWFGK